MIFADGLLVLVVVALWIFCIIDVITTPVPRNLPKFAWLLIVLILPDIGSVVWLIAGHDWGAAHGASRPLTAAGRAYPEYDRPGRATASNPDDDEDFLRTVRARAEAQRREYEVRRKAELEAEERERNRRQSPEDDA